MPNSNRLFREIDSQIEEVKQSIRIGEARARFAVWYEHAGYRQWRGGQQQMMKDIELLPIEYQNMMMDVLERYIGTLFYWETGVQPLPPYPTDTDPIYTALTTHSTTN